MTRFMRLFGLLIAVLALMGVAAASAMAAEAHLPLNLPQTTKDCILENDSAETKWESVAGNVLTAEKVKGTCEDTSDTLGNYSLAVENFKEGANTCTGAGDATGVVLSNGTYHYVFDSLSPLGVAVLFLTVATKFKCGNNLETTIEAGTLVCLILEPESSKAAHLIHCEQAKGVAKEKTWWNDNGEAQTASLKCSILGIKAGCAFLTLIKITFLEAKAFELV